MRPKYRIGTLAICALVALRVGIGLHFAGEGHSKLRDGFSSAGFLSSAKGPFAGYFHGFVWDADAKIRLGFDRTPRLGADGQPDDSQLGRPIINTTPTIAAWEAYREQVVLEYGYDERQARVAQQRFDERVKQLKRFFADNGEDIIKYFNGLDRRQNQLADDSYVGVESLQGQGKKLDTDLKKDRGAWLGALSLIWSSFERDMLSIASEEQRGSIAAPRLEQLEKSTYGTDFVDWLIPRMDLTIGILLIIGLFTRVTAVAGALFLGSVMLTQWPGAAGAAPIYYQLVEALALVVLATIGAGKSAGLDGVINHLLARCCSPKTGKNADEPTDS